jgi:hypothetical protein
VAASTTGAIDTIEKALPSGFPTYIHDSVKAGLTMRLKCL